MSFRAWRLVALVGLIVLAAGCVGGGEDERADPASAPAEAANATDRANASVAVDELWGGDDRLEIVNNTWTETVAFEADVACALGGTPQTPRTDERVLVGTDHLEVWVDGRNVNTGIQVGFLVDEDAPEHAQGQEAITWLDSVPPGMEQRFTVDVDEDETEALGEPRPWTFYVRMNPGVDEACYTGANVGERAVVVDAIRGT